MAALIRQVGWAWRFGFGTQRFKNWIQSHATLPIEQQQKQTMLAETFGHFEEAINSAII